MQLPRVFISQMLERWDSETERYTPTFNFNSAAIYGTLTPVLERDDHRLLLTRQIEKIKVALSDFSDDDFLIAVGDPSVIAICAGVILRRSRNLKLLKWDKRVGQYIVTDINL